VSICIYPTIAMARDDKSAVQCMHCGCIAVVPSKRVYSRTQPLGICPVCSEYRWKLQIIPVGGIGVRGDEGES